MQKGANFVRGWADVQVTGAAPEEFFNLCAQRDIHFWRVRKEDAVTWFCRVSFLDYPKLSDVARRSRCEVILLDRGGLTGLIWKARYRYALLAGLAVCLGLVSLLGQVVLTVQVSGNVEVPTGAILSQLKAQGVKPGAFGPALDTRQIGHAVILELPELAWMTINLRGTVAEVVVREGRPRPELMEEDETAHIVAKHPGIITRIQTTRGQQLVERGDTVAAGDTLIGSWVDFEEPEYYNGDMGGMTVRATGRVWARTWHTLKAAIPLEGQAKCLTGRDKNRWSLEILGHSLEFYKRGGIPYEKYDKITTYHTARLPGGLTLPIALRHEVCREYSLEDREIDRERAETVLKAHLEERLEALVEQGEVRKVDWSVDERDGLMTVTLLAECEQEIGLTVEE